MQRAVAPVRAALTRRSKCRCFSPASESLRRRSFELIVELWTARLRACAGSRPPGPTVPRSSGALHCTRRRSRENFVAQLRNFVSRVLIILVFHAIKVLADKLFLRTPTVTELYLLDFDRRRASQNRIGIEPRGQQLCDVLDRRGDSQANGRQGLDATDQSPSQRRRQAITGADWIDDRHARNFDLPKSPPAADARGRPPWVTITQTAPKCSVGASRREARRRFSGRARVSAPTPRGSA